jgi:mRNA-degrading endonuclease RelE of RelBE toxin-antitoxin system
LYRALPADIRALADKNFALLKSDPRHPSLHLKRIDGLWSVRIGDHYRALGTEVKEGFYWIWIGTHAEYDRIVG